MNQVLQRTVYQMGNRGQAQFMADLAGMNEEERTAFFMIHEGQKERAIMDTLGMDSKAYGLVENAIRAKLLVAVFHCISYTQDHS